MLIKSGAALLVAGSFVNIYGWGCEGHHVTAIIAQMHLTPAAAKQVDDLLTQNPIDPALRRFCKAEGLSPMVDSSTWADDYRSIDRSTGPWHYIDIPLSAKDPSETDLYCTGGCILTAIADNLKILQSSQDGATRAKALRFLIHLVADLHQPLHAASNNDRGGNCVPIHFFDTKARTSEPRAGQPPSENYNPNLHGVWDYLLIQTYLRKNSLSVEQWAERLESRYKDQAAAWQKPGIGPAQWAIESNQLARRVVYGALPAQIPVEQPIPVESCAADNHIARRIFALNEQVGESYFKQAIPLTEERLAAAGYRLAELLNKALPSRDN